MSSYDVRIYSILTNRNQRGRTYTCGGRSPASVSARCFPPVP